MSYTISILPQNVKLEAEDGAVLLEVLRREGLAPDAPCGGHGTCGKCRVLVDGVQKLACEVRVASNLTVVLPDADHVRILHAGAETGALQADRDGFLLAFDIGTTTVVGYLLHGGKTLASESMLNPQTAFGADVITRIRHAVNGGMEQLTALIRGAVERLALSLCRSSGTVPESVKMVSLVGNPAMQQLFLGILPDNLVKLPFEPVLTEAKTVPARAYLPGLPNAELLIVPDISGYVGADTVACVLSTGLDRQDGLRLLVDIGTNGEMVMASGGRMVACSTAAGPALEGAGIRFGMRGAAGAIDHVLAENGTLRCSVIGGGRAKGICGSGLIDAAAAALELGLINSRGRIQSAEEIDGERYIPLCDGIYLTQSDIRALQMAKGAIAAGIELMSAHLGVTAEEIGTVYLAGAFGSFMDAASACRIGLLPGIEERKIKAVGNAAGSGAKLLACRENELERAARLVKETEFLELAADPEFTMCFAENMGFDG